MKMTRREFPALEDRTGPSNNSPTGNSVQHVNRKGIL